MTDAPKSRTRARKLESSLPTAHWRRRAEARLREQQNPKAKSESNIPPNPISDYETRRLLHELQVHQIELEMQNEALTQSNERAAVYAEKLRLLNTDLEERVRQRTATISALAAELTLAEQRERLRLSQLLHDHLQQLLVSAKYLLASLRPDCSQKARSTLQEVDRVLSQCVEASRTLAVELSPPILREAGLIAAVNWLANWMRDKHGLHVRLVARSRALSLPNELSVLLYHAIRELLFNVVKHAHVMSASILMTWTGAQLRIVVGDKGMGFNPTLLQAGTGIAGGFGLLSVRERLAQVGGHLKIESAPGRGSQFTLRLPLRQPLPDGLAATGKGTA